MPSLVERDRVVLSNIVRSICNTLLSPPGDVCCPSFKEIYKVVNVISLSPTFEEECGPLFKIF